MHRHPHRRTVGVVTALGATLLVAAVTSVVAVPALMAPHLDPEPVAVAGPDAGARLKARVAARAATLRPRAAVGGTAAALPPGGAGNGIFQVYVEQGSVGAGSFTVLTGPDHPAGPGHNVLFGDGVPGTSYLIVRQIIPPVDDDTPEQVHDWVQGQLITHDTESSLDDWYPETEPLGTTGFRTGWFVSSFGELTEDVVVHGTTLADSTVEVTTTIAPFNENDGRFEVQYLWDVANGADDGPVLQPRQGGSVYRPFDPVVPTEQVVDDGLAVADNDANAATPTLGTGIAGGPTAPDAVSYVCWGKAVFAPFGEYQPDPTLDVSTSASECPSSVGPDDSAVELVWRPDVPAGEPVTVSASLFASPHTPYPTAMTAAPIKLGSPAFTATLTDTGAGKRVAGRTVAFRAGTGGNVLCTAVTSATGVASCGGLTEALAATLALGYTASYPGGAIWAPASVHRGILG